MQSLPISLDLISFGLEIRVSYPTREAEKEELSLGTGGTDEILVLRNLRTGSGPGRALTDLSCRRDVFCIILSITIRLTGGCR